MAEISSFIIIFQQLSGGVIGVKSETYDVRIDNYGARRYKRGGVY